jgi:DNA-directed RNA polymerase subunit RPC12/RpoP
MMQIAVFLCSKCGSTLEVAHRPITRVLPGETTGAGFVHAWCFDQQRLVLAEDMPTLEELREERDEVAEVRRTTPEGALVEVPTVEWVEAQMRWRANRTSPARCLECGSTRIIIESREADSLVVEHPGCGGRFKLKGLRYSDETPARLRIDAEGGVIGEANGRAP